MAGLQLASYLPVGVMLPYNKTEAPGLHSAKQDPYGQGDCAQWFSMGHQRNSIQRKLLSKKELILLDNVYTHPQWDTFVKARSYSYPRCAGISQQDSETNLQGQGKGLFYSSDPQSSHSWHAKANCQDAIPFTKKRVGVDRAYPLKPVLHQKSHSAGEACVDEDQNVSPRPPEPRDFSYSSFCSRNLVNPSVVGPVVATQGQRARAKPNRTEQMQIQRLEAEGVTLEEEIRRKETLLREKLKKTEEELRRIQKEKDEAKGNEKGDIQRTTLSQKRVKSNRSNSRYKALFSPKFGPEEVFSRHRREGKTWGQLQDNFSPFQFSDCGIQRIKRERPVTSNNKIQDEISGPSAEKLPQSSEALGIALWGPTSSSSLSGALDSSSSSCCTEEPKLRECSHCGRKFHLLRLEKHSSVCSRMQGSKRKVFDSSRARAKGTELEQYLNWKGPASVQAEPPRKNNWRQKHESFIRTLRQAREIQQIIAKGGSPSELPPILPVENPDYIQCPHCSRHFAPKVAERHIPKCKTIKNRPPPPRRHCS